MSDFVPLKVEKREALGKAHVRKLRFLEPPKVPGIVYGKKTEPVPVQCSEKDLAKILSEGHHLALINSGDGEGPVWIKDVQYDTYGDRILHVDLLRIDADQEMETEVELEFVGVDEVAGVFQTLRVTAPVIGKVTELPESIRVVVSGMQVGDQVTLGDLELPNGVRIAGDPKLGIASVQASKAEIAAEAAAEEGAEGAPAAGGEAKA